MTGKPLLDYGSAHSKLTKNGMALSCLHAALTCSGTKTMSKIFHDQNRLKLALVSPSLPHSERVCTVSQDEFTHQLAQFNTLLKNYTPP